MPNQQYGSLENKCGCFKAMSFVCRVSSILSGISMVTLLSVCKERVYKRVSHKQSANYGARYSKYEFELLMKWGSAVCVRVTSMICRKVRERYSFINFLTFIT